MGVTPWRVDFRDMNINQEIIVKCLQQRASIDERSQLEQWLNEKSSHKAYFEQISTVWDQADCNVDKVDLDPELAWNCITSKISTSSAKEIIPNRFENWLRIAASIVLILGIGLGLFYFQSSPSVDAVSVVNTSSASEVREVLLPDGSSITLMPHSSISYVEDFKNSREVDLAGGAYFDIQKMDGKPFNVNIDELGVKVLGTRFMIEQSDESTLVYVEEGKVEVGLVDQSFKSIVTADEGVYLDRLTSSIQSIETSTDNMLAWKSGVLEFDNVRLTEVLKDIGKHYNVNVKLKNSDIGKCHLTSRFDNKSLDEVFEVLEIVLNIEIKRSSQNEYLISGKGC